MRLLNYALLLALRAGGFTTNRTPRPPKATTRVQGIANFGTFFAESWLGAGACSSRKCPPAKDVFDHVLVDVNQYVHTSARRATSLACGHGSQEKTFCACQSARITAHPLRLKGKCNELAVVRH